jgi:hypothetical protein
MCARIEKAHTKHTTHIWLDEERVRVRASNFLARIHSQKRRRPRKRRKRQTLLTDNTNHTIHAGSISLRNHFHTDTKTPEQTHTWQSTQRLAAGRIVHSSHAGPELEPLALTVPAAVADAAETHGEASDMVADDEDEDETGCALSAEVRERSAGEDCIEIWARSAAGRWGT